MMETLAASSGLNVSLPEYTVSPPPPDYSSTPLAQEQSLSYSFSNSRRYSLPTGTFTKTKQGLLTLALTEQEDDAITPIYDGFSPVRGIVAPENPDCISKVEIKLTGQLETTCTAAGSLTGSRTVSRKTTFLVGNMILWEASPGGNLPPSSIPFSFPFPKTFTDKDGSKYPLPPSHSYQCALLAGIIVSKVKYSLIVELHGRSPRSAVFSLLKLNTKCLKVRLTYIPRHRPFLPIQAHSDLIGTIKTCPEEWLQRVCRIPMRRSPGIKDEDYGDIHVNIFIPAVQIFGLRDSIPFHVQISGSPLALRLLLNPGVTQIACREDQLQLKVAIHRSFHLNVEGIKAAHTFTIGEGTVVSLPPAIDLESDDSSKNPSSPQLYNLDYEGNVCISPGEDVTFGGFHAGRTSVTDFLVLSVVPSPGHPYRSRWLPLQEAIRIRFVTDSWDDGVSIDGLV